MGFKRVGRATGRTDIRQLIGNSYFLQNWGDCRPPPNTVRFQSVPVPSPLNSISIDMQFLSIQNFMPRGRLGRGGNPTCVHVLFFDGNTHQGGEGGRHCEDVTNRKRHWAPCDYPTTPNWQRTTHLRPNCQPSPLATNVDATDELDHAQRAQEQTTANLWVEHIIHKGGRRFQRYGFRREGTGMAIQNQTLTRQSNRLIAKHSARNPNSRGARYIVAISAIKKLQC